MSFVYVNQGLATANPTTKSHASVQDTATLGNNCFGDLVSALSDPDVIALGAGDDLVINVFAGGAVDMSAFYALTSAACPWDSLSILMPKPGAFLDRSLPYLRPAPGTTREAAVFFNVSTNGKTFNFSVNVSFEGSAEYRQNGATYDIIWDGDNNTINYDASYINVDDDLDTNPNPPTQLRIASDAFSSTNVINGTYSIVSNRSSLNVEAFRGSNINTVGMLGHNLTTMYRDNNISVNNIDIDVGQSFFNNTTLSNNAANDTVDTGADGLNNVDFSAVFPGLASFDYTPVSGSVLEDAGLDVTTIGLNPSGDFFGNSVPNGIGYDIGPIDLAAAPVPTILAVGDNSLQPGETVTIRAFSVDASPTNQQIDFIQGSNLVPAVVNSWAVNGNEVDIEIVVPDSTLLLENSSVTVRLTDDNNTASRSVTLENRTGYEQLAWNGSAPGGQDGQSLQTEAVTDLGVTAVSGDFFQIESAPTVTLNEDTTIEVSDSNNVGPLNYRIYQQSTEEYTAWSQFSVVNGTIVAGDSTPDAYSFTNNTSVQSGSAQTSNAITVTGIDTTAPISITNGQYQVSTDGGATFGAPTSIPGAVSLNDQVRLVATAPALPGESLTVTPIIGGVSADWVITTEANAVDNIGPDITVPSVNGFTILNGSAGLAHNDAALIAAIAAVTATDETAPANPIVTNNLSTLPDPLPFGNRTIVFSATDAAGNLTQEPWDFSVTEAPPITGAVDLQPVLDAITALDARLTQLSTNVAALGIARNQSLDNFAFQMVFSADHVTPATGLTVAAQRSIDGSGFVDADGAVTEISNGLYVFNAASADTDGRIITWRFSASNADDVLVTFFTV